MATNSIQLGHKIRQFRTAKGLSQMQLEIETGSSPGSFSRIESGKINPTKETLLKIVEALDLDAFDTAQLFDIEVSEIIADTIQLIDELDANSTLGEILQKSTNGLVYKLKLLGSIIFLVEGDYVYSKTFTQSWYTDLALRIINLPFDKLSASLIDEKYTENFVVRCINGNKLMYSTDLKDFVVPVVSPQVSDILQKVTGHRSAITLPITYNGKVLGAIFFSKSTVSDFKNELPIFQAFARHLGTIIFRVMD